MERRALAATLFPHNKIFLLYLFRRQSYKYFLKYKLVLDSFAVLLFNLV